MGSSVSSKRAIPKSSTIIVKRRQSVLRSVHGQICFVIKALRHLVRNLHSPSSTPIAIALDRMADLSRELLCVIGRDGYLQIANSSFMSALGYSGDGLFEKEFLDFIHPEDRKEAERALLLLSTSGAASSSRNRFQCKDGTYRLLTWNLSINDGEDVIYAKATIDSSDKGAEQSLVASESFNRSIIKSSGDCIKVLDLDGRLQYMSQGGQDMLCIKDLDPYLGIAYDCFWEGSDKTASKGAIAEALKGGQGRFQGYAPTAMGAPKWWDVVVTPIFGEEDHIVENLLVISRDITERIRAEKALTESQELFCKAQAFARIGHWTLEADMHTAYWSEEVFRIVGQRPDVIPGPETLKKIVHPEDISATISALSEAITLGKIYDTEYRIILPENEVRWVACKATPVCGENGEIIRLSGIVQDITKRKINEEKIQASLNEKEVLLREVHHRVKNNLQVIASLLSLQAMHVDSDEAVEALNESARRIQLMAKIHNRLYRSTDLAHVEFDLFLRSLTEEMLAAHRADESMIRLRFDLEPVVLSLENAIPCSQIASELISNSIKHAFPGYRRGSIMISLRIENGRVHLTVSDDGVGLPDRFDYRCSQSLGLKVVQALAEQLNAELIIEQRTGVYCHLVFAGEAGE